MGVAHRYLFKEMDAAGMVWPEDGKIKLLELSDKWQKEYHAYWFKKWFYKSRRKKILLRLLKNVVGSATLWLDITTHNAREKNWHFKNFH